MIFQAKVTIENEDSIEIIASKVHELEQANFPKVIQNLLNKDYSWNLNQYIYIPMDPLLAILGQVVMGLYWNG